MTQAVDGLARRSTPGFLLFASLIRGNSSQHRLQIDVALRREWRCSDQQLRTEQRSLTTEGSRHALRECQGSRNATTANLLENSAMWKGGLASTRASVSPRQKWRVNSRRKPCESEEGLQDLSIVVPQGPGKTGRVG